MNNQGTPNKYLENTRRMLSSYPRNAWGKCRGYLRNAWALAKPKQYLRNTTGISNEDQEHIQVLPKIYLKNTWWIPQEYCRHIWWLKAKYYNCIPSVPKWCPKIYNCIPRHIYTQIIYKHKVIWSNTQLIPTKEYLRNTWQIPTTYLRNTEGIRKKWLKSTSAIAKTYFRNFEQYQRKDWVIV